MKAIVLAAGYAERLYPLTKDRPKPLLPIGARPILSHILSKILASNEIDETYVVTNNKFYLQFCDWAKREGFEDHCVIVNDGTLEKDKRLGAIGDIQFVLDIYPVEGDVLILAGDNLFEFCLEDFLNLFKERGSSVACFDVQDKEAARRYGVLELDEAGKIIQFLEKPSHPPTSLISTGVYAYTASDLVQVAEYLKVGGNPDQPGHFLKWLSERKDVFGYVIQGRWFDIGDLESYQKADEIYKNTILKEKI